MGVWTSGGALATARNKLAGCGTQTAGLSFGGISGANNVAITEEYNGTAWSSGGAYTANIHALAGAGTQTAGLGFGGWTNSLTNVTKEYNGTAWSSGGSLNTGRRQLAGCGTQTAGLSFGGWTSYCRDITEEYDGTAWSSGGVLTTARTTLAGAGTQTAGLSFGGWTDTYSIVTEEYNGTSWSNGGSLTTARHWIAGCGLQTAGLSFGGDAAAGSYSTTTEEYNGTAWSSGGNLNTGRRMLAGCGIQSAGLSFGGDTGGDSAVTEEYTISAEETEIKKPTAFTDPSAKWNNEAQAYDVATGNDQTTAADSDVGPNDIDPWITFHTWGAKVETYTATKLKVNWKTNGSYSNDEFSIQYTKDGGSNWIALLALGVHNDAAIATLSADLDANQDLTQVQVKLNYNKVAGGDSGITYIYDIWTEGTYTAASSNIKSLNTNLKANIKTINGNAIANVKSLNTNT